MEQNAHASSYGLDPWKLVEPEFRKDRIAEAETIFASANGYLGIRGAFEERTPVYHPGTYINGIFETKPINYGETAYGFAKQSQTILNLTDAGIIQLYIDDELFDLSTGRVLEYSRVLDMRAGIVERRVLWESPSGRKVRVETRRLVSFTRRHLAVFDWSCSLVDSSAAVTVLGVMNGAVKNLAGFEDPRIGANFQGQVLEIRRKKAEGNLSLMTSRVQNSGFVVACAALDVLEAAGKVAFQSEIDRHRIVNRYVVNAEPGMKISLSRFVAYYTSRDAAASRLTVRAKNEVRTASHAGLEALIAEQQDFMDGFWKRTDIRIEGDELMNQSLRFNTYHILQGTGTDGYTNAPAKGLTGEGYDGHYFWDSEIYVLPLFAYTNPLTARKMLEYRYRTLDKARERAAELSHKGALFPWRTINGEEASAYFPAGTAQYHINADIVYAVKKYVEASGDLEFLRLYGAEIALETARFWMTLGDFIPGRGFCINTVTGPDEYSAIVNNNVYTNLMAKMNLEFALYSLEVLKKDFPGDYSRLAAATGFQESEAAAWKRAAGNVYVPFDSALGIYAQDDSFLQRAKWDFEAGKGKHPLLLYFHPLTIYRYQMLKQPDLVLAQFLLGSHFTTAEKKRNFDYYDALVTGDSSLGPCIQSVMSAELGYIDLAYSYFMKTARMDLDNINGNVRDGVHMAAMAGTWTALIFGFAGLRDGDGRLSFRPRLPSGWSRLAFRLTVRDCLLDVDITQHSVRYTLLEGTDLSFRHAFRTVRLAAGESVEISLEAELRAVIFDRDTLPASFWESDAFPGLLLSLVDRKIKTALVSESKDIMPGHRIHPVPDSLFQLVQDGKKIVKGRPDPEIYFNAADALEELPEDCLVVTGSPEGALASAAGRFFTIGYRTPVQGRGVTISDAAEVRHAVLDGIFQAAGRSRESVRL